MSLYEFAACVDGHNRANAPSKEAIKPPSAEEFYEARRMHGDDVVTNGR